MFAHRSNYTTLMLAARQKMLFVQILKLYDSGNFPSGSVLESTLSNIFQDPLNTILDPGFLSEPDSSHQTGALNTPHCLLPLPRNKAISSLFLSP